MKPLLKFLDILARMQFSISNKKKTHTEKLHKEIAVCEMNEKTVLEKDYWHFEFGVSYDALFLKCQVQTNILYFMSLTVMILLYIRVVKYIVTSTLNTSYTDFWDIVKST